MPLRSRSTRSVSPSASDVHQPHKTGSPTPKVEARPASPLAARTVKPKKLSASEQLLLELQDAESELNAVEPRLSVLRQNVARQRRCLHEATVEHSRELVAAEEAAAVWAGRRNSVSSVGAHSCAQLFDEEATLRERLKWAEARSREVDEAVASELYWRWKTAFEAHLRAGGRFEDFCLDGFFHDCYGVATVEDLRVPLQDAQRLWHEYQDLSEHATAALTVESQLRQEHASLEAELKRLRYEVKQEEAHNYLWWQGQLTEKPRLNELRGEQNRWQLEHTELEWELHQFHDRHMHANEFIDRQSAEAAELRAQVLPCEQLVNVMEHSFEVNEAHGERIKQTVEMKEYQLDQHKLIRTWKREIRRLDRDGPEFAQEAMEHLHEAAVEVQHRDFYKDQMRELATQLGIEQRQAIALNDEYQQTAHLLKSTTDDLHGLQFHHDELCANLDRARFLLDKSDADDFVTRSPPESRRRAPASQLLDDDASSTGVALRPMQRAKALALGQSHGAQAPALDEELSSANAIGAGAVAFAARAAHAKAVPRPLPIASAGVAGSVAGGLSKAAQSLEIGRGYRSQVAGDAGGIEWAAARRQASAAGAL